jgi:predicted secreted protein
MKLIKIGVERDPTCEVTMAGSADLTTEVVYQIWHTNVFWFLVKAITTVVMFK